mgnify:CR=1 FL=1
MCALPFTFTATLVALQQLFGVQFRLRVKFSTESLIVTRIANGNRMIRQAFTRALRSSQLQRRHALHQAPLAHFATTVAGASDDAPHLVVVGSACVDCFIDVPRLPVQGETLASPNPRTGTLLPGGKGANQAAAAARFGAETFFDGRFGDDADADVITSTMEGFGVDLSLSLRDPTCPSGKAFIFLEPTGHNSIVIVQGTNIEGWTPVNLFTPQLEDSIRKAGAVLLQREIPDFVNLAVAKFASSAGVPVLLDVGGKDSPLDPELAPYITICWPNETELMNISGGLPTGTDDEIAAAVAVLREQGVREVLVTLGEAGSMMFEEGVTNAKDAIRGPCYKVDKVVDTTGAGDCFRAAYVVTS